MRKPFVVLSVFAVLGIFLAGCGAPPPLKSDKYLNDTTLIADDAKPQTFHDIVIGQTKFVDAMNSLKADPAFENVQNQENPPAANWSAKGGEFCCQMSADKDTGLVNAILVRVAPNITAKQVIDKYGEPKFVNTADYSDKEVVLTFIYPDEGIIAWVAPGDASSTVAENSPVVMYMYFDKKDWQRIQDQGTFQGWMGFKAFADYKAATPIVTPAVTPTPQ
jgi:hypothetical protein